MFLDGSNIGANKYALTIGNGSSLDVQYNAKINIEKSTAGAIKVENAQVNLSSMNSTGTIYGDIFLSDSTLQGLTLSTSSPIQGKLLLDENAATSGLLSYTNNTIKFIICAVRPLGTVDNSF